MDYLKRMEDELEELEDKRSRGEDFITTERFSELHLLDQRLLFAQLSAMEAYSEVLYSRILRTKEFPILKTRAYTDA